MASAVPLVALSHQTTEPIDAVAGERSFMEAQLRYVPVFDVHEDGSVRTSFEPDDYFLANDDWHQNHFMDSPTIQGLRKGLDHPLTKEQMRHNCAYLHFNATNPQLRTELKFSVHRALYWGIVSPTVMFSYYAAGLRMLCEFANARHADLDRLEDFNNDEILAEFRCWLESHGYDTVQKYHQQPRAGMKHGRQLITAIERMNKWLNSGLVDYRAEHTPHLLWAGDVWYANDLKRFNVRMSDKDARHPMRFDQIPQKTLRESLKSLLKERLLSRQITWGTASQRLLAMEKLADIISELHPDWEDLSPLSRRDMLEVTERIHGSATKRSAVVWLRHIRTTVTELQLGSYPGAPREDARRLVPKSDTPQLHRNPDSVKYIPEPVLSQLMEHIDELKPDYRLAVQTMLVTGLRVSDVLTLPLDCLERINGRDVIVCDIQKTQTLDHHVFVPADYAAIMRRHIAEVERQTNDLTNPRRLVFVHLTGTHRGSPYSSETLNKALNQLAKKHSITDDDGTVFHFHNHAFRHTYAVRLINAGASLLTVQHLLAHKSPAMTLVYAQLLEDTKFREWQKAQDCFQLQKDGQVVSLNPAEAEDIAKAVWANERIDVVDTPFGTCLQRKGGRCRYSTMPPCIDCGDGEPCKNIAIGLNPMDATKYDTLIQSYELLTATAEVNGNAEAALANQAVSEKLRSIKSRIADGGVIFGNAKRLLGTEDA